MAMILQLTDDVTIRLRQRAEAEGTSENDVALKAIQQYLADETSVQAPEAAVEQVKTHYASSFKRLGE